MEIATVAYILVGALLLIGKRSRAIVEGHNKAVTFCLVVGWLLVWPVVVVWSVVDYLRQVR